MGLTTATHYLGGAQSGSFAETLYNELWYACAGLHVSVPQGGEWVYYFPQGHLEQLDVSVRPDLDQQRSAFYLPDKMLCKVVNVQLRAEPNTDEVYAQITLLPDGKQSEVAIPDPPVPEPPLCTVYSFCKKLTSSDLNTQSGFLLPRNADNCLPPLDMSQLPPSQELVATDLHGKEWRFKHTLKGQPRRHSLTNGWSTFVMEKNLVSGDILIFLRGRNGELHVGVRKLKKHFNNHSSVISSHSHVGVLAASSHAITNGTLFSVIFKPRTSPSGFIISLSKYLEAQNHQLSVGMRCKMTFDDEKIPKRRFRGTIVGVADTSSTKCLVSEWRSVQVKWDDEKSSILLPDRLSPWEIELQDTDGWSCCFGKLSKLLCWK